VFVDGSTAGSGAQIVSWSWDFGDGTAGTGPSPTHQYAANGSYTVCLTVLSSNQCTDQYCTTVEINCITQCEAFYQYTTGLCPSVVFADNSTAGSGAQIVSWSWDFGDGTTGTGPSPTHQYAANGTYTACLIIETSDGCTSDYCTTVEINCITQCEAFYQYTTGLCPSIVFVDGSTAGSGAQIVSWSWDFGDGTTGTGPTQTHQYAANGIYTVCLTVLSSNQCTDQYCTTVEIDCMVGLSETGANTFTLYPNPVADYLTVDLLQSGFISYRIIGMNGVEYGHGNFMSSTSHTIDVRKLQQGIYLIDFEVNGQQNSERFIKM
jgi:PKD repeat protein